MCRLVRCDETGGCLSSSLGCCFECGLTVGVKADFALPDRLLTSVCSANATVKTTTAMTARRYTVV